MNEEKIIELVVEKEDWEEVLYHIVSVEKMDVWNIDLVKLVDRFISYIQTLQVLDFRIPAKIVFVATLLLKLKAEYLSIFEEKETIEEVAKEEEFIDLGINPDLIPLGIPIKRVPKRQITLNDLIIALRKALRVRERRIERRRLWKRRLRAEIAEEEDITKRIEELMQEVETLIKKMRSDRVGFSQIVKEWKREKIVEKFIPLLHLEMDKKVETLQEEFFKEIWIKLKQFNLQQ